MKCGGTRTVQTHFFLYIAKKPVRIVSNVDYQHPSNVLFIELHVLKLHDLIELRTAMTMYDANTGCLPVNLHTTLCRQ